MSPSPNSNLFGIRNRRIDKNRGIGPTRMVCIHEEAALPNNPPKVFKRLVHHVLRLDIQDLLNG